MTRHNLYSDGTPPPLSSRAPRSTSDYCRSVCDLIGNNLVELQAVDDNNENNELLLADGVVGLQKRSKYREWFMAMAAQLADEHHPGQVPAPTGMNDGKVNAAEVSTAEVNIPSCQDCGAALQPGYKGSTMRLRSVPKPARTRQPKSSKKEWAIPTSGVGRPSSTQGCKNVVVVTCGTCQSRTTYPGLASSSNSNNSNKDTGAKNNEKAKKPTPDKKRTREEPATNTNAAASLDRSLDFVPLPGDATKKAVAKKRSPDLLPLQNPKKKKRNKQKKPSQMLDFLSSLND